jgi:hypothetical protein
MPERRRTFSPQFKTEAVRMVIGMGRPWRRFPSWASMNDRRHMLVEAAGGYAVAAGPRGSRRSRSGARIGPGGSTGPDCRPSSPASSVTTEPGRSGANDSRSSRPQRSAMQPSWDAPDPIMSPV